MTSKDLRQKALTAYEIQQLDKTAIEQHGVPSLFLMENAGRAVAQEACKHLKSKRRKEVSVFCGTGNNGGDGFVAARHLVNEGAAVHVFIVGEPSQLKPDAQINFKKLDYDVNIRPIESVSSIVKTAVKDSSIIIDAIFGFGLNREIRDSVYDIIDFINRAKKKIIAVDVPSGLDATTGKILGICVKADTTVTFSAPKKGFFLNEGPRYAGRIKVADIGIPKELLKHVLMPGLR